MKRIANVAPLSRESSVREADGFVRDAGQSFTAAFLAAIGAEGLRQSSFRVLDVGTGMARIPIEICKRRSGIAITAVDRSHGILRRARGKIAQAGLEDAIHVDQADACSLPFADASFDAVLSNGLIHHVPDRRGVLREMLRVLRPGGVLFVRDTLPRPDADAIAQILLRSAGGSRENRRSVFERVFQAALTLDEARDLASAAGVPIEWVRQTGLRHWLICGRLRGVA